MFCWLTLLGFLYAARNDRFIRVDFLVNRLKGIGRDVADIAASACGFALSAIVCYATVKLAYTSYLFHATSSQYSETLLVIPQSIMPVAYFLLAVVYAEGIVRGVLRLCGRGGRSDRQLS
jgi:TRAP-type C4-dicarboxylate transport system permease small subunit